MEERPLTDVKDKAIQDHLAHIYQNARSEETKAYDAEPTTETLLDGQEAYYNTRIYRNVNGTIYYWAVTAA